MATAATTAPRKNTYSNGTDIKSVLLNLSSIGFIVIPVVWYYFYRYHASVDANDTVQRSAKELFALGVVILYGIAYLIPPMGWRRPHPYSDDPNNVPMGHKQH